MKVETLKIGDVIYSVDKGRVYIFLITNLKRDPAASNILYTAPEISVNPITNHWSFQKESYVSSNPINWSKHTIENCSPIEDLMPQGKRSVLRVLFDGNKF